MCSGLVRVRARAVLGVTQRLLQRCQRPVRSHTHRSDHVLPVDRKRASCDRFICADESNDEPKVRDRSRGESLRPGLPGSKANTLNAPSAPSSGAFVAGESVRGLSFLHLYSHILSRRTLTHAPPTPPNTPHSPPHGQRAQPGHLHPLLLWQFNYRISAQTNHLKDQAGPSS